MELLSSFNYICELRLDLLILHRYRLMSVSVNTLLCLILVGHVQRIILTAPVSAATLSRRGHIIVVVNDVLNQLCDDDVLGVRWT